MSGGPGETPRGGVASNPRWMDVVQRYQRPVLWRSAAQVATSVLLFFLVWWLAVRAAAWSTALALAVDVVATLFLVRVFIVQHDCGHGSFLPGRLGNVVLGSLCGVLTLVPFAYWRDRHAVHHVTVGNLDREDVGDITTLTVADYLAGSPLRRLAYRLYRHPLVLLGIGPTYYFLFNLRFAIPFRDSRGRELDRATRGRHRASVHLTNLAVLALAGLIVWRVGWRAFLLVQLPISVLTATIGIWLFYVQHQFEGAYRVRAARWSFVDAALQGSSYYRLPRVLAWFTGDIGLHHLHHLGPRIPNYHLRRCLAENPSLARPPLTLRRSLRCLSLHLWDEEQGRLISFRELSRR